MILMAAAMLLQGIVAIDNGVGLTPPMGWRHWKAFYADISQEIMESMMDEMATPRPVDGVNTSLKDLGYLYVGLDDHWQNCTRTCPNGTVIPSWLVSNGFDYKGCYPNNTGSSVVPWYNEDGVPQVDQHRFPDLKGMVAKAHGMGLRAGWYFGNYQCRDGAVNHSDPSPVDWVKLVAGSVKAIADYGFDSVKLDSGFPVGSNLTLWAELLNKTGRPVMVENCHQGGDGPGSVRDAAQIHGCTGLTPTSDCPFNFFRTSGDPEPGWGTIMRELNTLRQVEIPAYGNNSKWHPHPPYNPTNSTPRSRPGGWAYPGTMVVGDGDMTYEENQVHFGGWCIVSSPLILAFNMSDVTRRELVWDIITNKEAIQVNQAWAGHPGSQVLYGLGNNSQVEVWTKPLGGDRTAVFIINTADAQNPPPFGSGSESAAGASAATGHDDVAGAGGSVPRLSPCDSTSTSQRWKLSPGVTPGSAHTTNLISAVPPPPKNGKPGWPNCISIHACDPTAQKHPVIGACKALPKSGCAKPCDCNTAWLVHANCTITSAMDGQCLTAIGTTDTQMQLCNGKPSQQYDVTRNPDGSLSFANGGACVDSAPGAGPAPGPPGPPHPHPPPPSIDSATVTVQLDELSLGISGPVKVRDVWHKRDLPTAAAGTISATVPHHGSVFLVLMPPSASWPLPFELAPWMKVPPPPVPPSA